MNNGTATLPWGRDLWDGIHRVVHRETRRVEVAPKLLPLYGPVPDALTLPADPITREQGKLTIDEAAVSPLNEVWVEFALTPQQVRDEADLGKARSLGIRAANFLARGVDALIFNGETVLKDNPLFTGGPVRHRSGPPGRGLLNAPLEARQIIGPNDLKTDPADFPQALFEAVTEGYARLQDLGHYGPYALVLNTSSYAGANAPQPTSFILETDRLRSLVTDGLFGTGTLPEPPVVGLLLSLGGNTMDLAIGKETCPSFLQEDDDGKFRFRVWKRFALRLKDATAVIKLDFAETGAKTGSPKGKPSGKGSKQHAKAKARP